jgi:hypothetical protein
MDQDGPRLSQPKLWGSRVLMGYAVDYLQPISSEVSPRFNDGMRAPTRPKITSPICAPLALPGNSNAVRLATTTTMTAENG